MDKISKTWSGLSTGPSVDMKSQRSVAYSALSEVYHKSSIIFEIAEALEAAQIESNQGTI